MNQFLYSIQEFLRPLNPAQKVILFTLLIGVVTLFSMLSWWAFKPKYSTLMGALNPDMANEVVRQLESMNVPYELKDGGQTIAVPSDQVYDLRLRISPLISGSATGMGYELFDKSTLGMTDFMQKLNKSRALEGELSRTINSLEQIEHSRLHIVMPERSVFQRTEVRPTVSVFVKIRAGSRLTDHQIDGIASLVAGSIEGMTTENVVILDQLGNRLSDQVSKSGDSNPGGANLTIKKEFEGYLTSKGQSLVDQMLGPGNGIVRVNTDHTFERIVRSSELIDPETRIIISEDRQTTSSNNEFVTNAEDYLIDGEAFPRQQDTKNDQNVRQTRNYKVSQTSENVEINAGELVKISASLVLNHKLSGIDENQKPTYIPWSDEELENVRRSLASAIGINMDRGDELTVTQIQFNDPLAHEPLTESVFSSPIPVMDLIQFVVLTIVFVIISILVLRTFKTMTKTPYELPSASGVSPTFPQRESLPSAPSELTVPAGQREQIAKFVQENHAESVSALRTLMTTT